MAGTAVDGNGPASPAPPAEQLLSRVARLVATEQDLDQLDRLAEAATGLLTLLNAQRRALRTVQPPVAPSLPPVEWLSAKEVATLIKRSESTIRHLPPDAIPGRRQFAKGHKVAWNKQIVLDWMRTC